MFLGFELKLLLEMRDGFKSYSTTGGRGTTEIGFPSSLILLCSIQFLVSRVCLLLSSSP
jgi:hypothetical protein